MVEPGVVGRAVRRHRVADRLRQVEAQPEPLGLVVRRALRLLGVMAYRLSLKIMLR